MNNRLERFKNKNYLSYVAKQLSFFSQVVNTFDYMFDPLFEDMKNENTAKKTNEFVDVFDRFDLVPMSSTNCFKKARPFHY